MTGRFRTWVWFAACAAAGLAAGIAWPPPAIPKSRGAEAPWALPDADSLARFSQENFGRASSAMRWDASGTEAAGAQSWRLAGFLYMTPVAALVEIQQDARARPKVMHARPGDTLPDGGRLIAIDGDTITAELDGCTTVYQLYRKQPVKQTGDCGQAIIPTENQGSTRE